MARKTLAPVKPARFLDPASPPTLMTLILIAGLPALGMNIFLPSLAGMALDFETDYAVMQLAISAYLALTGVLQLFLGPMSDRFGRRPVLLASFGVFTLASVGCALAPTAEIFLMFRMMQAVVASGIALSRAIVRDIVDARHAASMIGYVTMGMALVPMIGPSVGGLLDAAFGWRSNFVVLTAFSALVLAIVWFDLGETNSSQSGSFRDQVKNYPALLASRRFWGYTLVSAFASGAFFAFLGGAPFVAGIVLGMSPAEMGLYFGMIAGGYAMGNFMTARIATRMGVAWMLVAGTLVSVFGVLLGAFLFAMGIETPLALFGSIFFVGVGNGLTMPSASSGLLSVRPKLAGTASGLGGAIMIGGGAALSAVTGALLGPETGAWPLIFMMLASSAMSVLAALYTNRIEKEVAAE